MTRAELEKQLGIRNGVVRVGVLKNDTPTETFEAIAKYGYKIILVMHSALDPLTVDREKLRYILRCSDDNLKKKEELFEKYALLDDYEIVDLLLQHKILTVPEVKRKTEWAAEKGLFKITPLLLSYGSKGTTGVEGEKLLAHLKAELAGNKKGCVKHFREYAEDFCFDRELILLAVKKDGTLLSYAAPTLRADREIVIAALAADTGKGRPVLAFVSRSLYADEEVLSTAFAANPASITCLSREKQLDRETVALAISKNGKAYAYIDAAFQREKTFAIAALAAFDEAYLLITDEDLQKDEEIGVAAVQKNAAILAHPLFYDRFCKSERVMLEALKKDVRSIRYLPNAFKQDVEFAKKALAIDKGFIAGFFYNVQKDEEIARILQE